MTWVLFSKRAHYCENDKGGGTRRHEMTLLDCTRDLLCPLYWHGVSECGLGTWRGEGCKLKYGVLLVRVMRPRGTELGRCRTVPIRLQLRSLVRVQKGPDVPPPVKCRINLVLLLLYCSGLHLPSSG
jgi:hypothetical protein